MTDIPTIAELVRRMEESNAHAARRDEDLLTELRELRNDLRNNYVPAQVYRADQRTAIAEREADNAKVDAINKRLDGQDQLKRQLIAGLLVTAIPSLGGFLLAINNFMTVRGG